VIIPAQALLDRIPGESRMKHRTCHACAIAITIAFTACSPDRAVAPVADVAPSFAKAGNIDTDSRAILVWDDQVIVNSVAVPAGIEGDDYDRYSTLAGTDDEYQGQVCGVHAKIFNTSALSGSGDLVFDPDFDAPGKSCNGVSRKLRFHLSYDEASGVPGSATLIGTFTNVRLIWEIAAGQSRQQAMRFIFVNQAGCEALEFNSAIGGGANDVQVTGLADGPNGRRWRVESTGTHRAMCMVSSKGKSVASGTTKYLPFAFTVTEVKYPYEITP
jgi:hypothetical protein